MLLLLLTLLHMVQKEFVAEAVDDVEPSFFNAAAYAVDVIVAEDVVLFHLPVFLAFVVVLTVIDVTYSFHAPFLYLLKTSENLTVF